MLYCHLKRSKMPELPEVEAARVILWEHCEGREITVVEAKDDEKIFDGATAEQVVSALQGRKLTAVGRKGKNLWFTLSGKGAMPLLHFGMTGYIAVRDAADGKVHIVAYENAPQDAGSTWPPRFHKLLLHFGPHPNRPNSPACELAYCDARRFGRMKLVDCDPANHETITKLGFDPLLEMPDLEAFKTLLATKSKGAARLKPLLLDQSFCAGVGNWVADEVLWHARLHPEQPVAQLQPEHIAALHSALHDVVQTAVAANADSTKFPKDWMFHVRWGKKAGTINGHKIDHITVGSRTSCYVPALQKLVGGATLPAAKQKKTAKQPAKNTRRKETSNAEDTDMDEQEQSGATDRHASGQKRGASDTEQAGKRLAKRAKQQERPATGQQEPAVTARSKQQRPKRSLKKAEESGNAAINNRQQQGEANIAQKQQAMSKTGVGSTAKTSSKRGSKAVQVGVNK